MRPTSLASLLTVFLGACGDPTRIEAPPPTALAEVVDEVALEQLPSVIAVPVEYDLAPALAWLEGVIPRRIGDIEQRHEASDRLRFAYQAERSPFRFHLNGTTATLTTVVSYGGRGWYNPPVLPTVSGSCGLNDTPPRVRVTVRTTVTPTADWRLRAQSRIVEMVPFSDEPRDRCIVTFAAINVTNRVLEAVRSVLEGELGKMDERLARYDLRDRVEDIWTFLQTPLRLQDSLWLVVDPAEIQLDRVRNEGPMLHTTIGMTAYPLVVGGRIPAPAVREIPPLVRSSASGGLALLTEGRIPWDVLTDILRRELVGDTILVAGRGLEIADLEVSGLDDGRVAVRLTLAGAARGTVYLVGRPEFNSRETVLTMPDLTFDVRSRSLMVSGLAWLAAGQVEEYLRTSLRVSLASVLEDGLTLLQRELSRDLATGVTLATEVTGGQVYRVRPRAEALLVDAIVQGSAELQLRLVPGRRVSR